MTFKRQTYDLLHAIAGGADPEIAYHPDARLWASHPWNEMSGLPAIRDFWTTLRHSFPDLERRDLIFLAGQSKEDKRVDPSFTGRQMVASLGHLQATFEADFMGIPATNGAVMLRLSEAHHVQNGKIAHSYMMIDLLDLMSQAGIWPMVPPYRPVSGHDPDGAAHRYAGDGFLPPHERANLGKLAAHRHSPHRSSDGV